MKKIWTFLVLVFSAIGSILVLILSVLKTNKQNNERPPVNQEDLSKQKTKIQQNAEQKKEEILDKKPEEVVEDYYSSKGTTQDAEIQKEVKISLGNAEKFKKKKVVDDKKTD